MIKKNQRLFMTKLHDDVLKAMQQGKLEGIEAQAKQLVASYQALAEFIVPCAAAFENEGYSETRALKAAILFVNYSEWKDD